LRPQKKNGTTKSHPQKKNGMIEVSCFVLLFPLSVFHYRCSGLALSVFGVGFFVLLLLLHFVRDVGCSPLSVIEVSCLVLLFPLCSIRVASCSPLSVFEFGCFVLLVFCLGFFCWACFMSLFCCVVAFFVGYGAVVVY